MRHPRPEAATAVLDIGGDVGALLVEVDVMPAGGELHARRAGDPSAAAFHTGVHSRWAGKTVTNVALFPAVRSGTYDVLGQRGAPSLRVVVAGGEVTTAVLTFTPRSPACDTVETGGP